MINMYYFNLLLPLEIIAYSVLQSSFSGKYILISNTGYVCIMNE